MQNAPFGLGVPGTMPGPAKDGTLADLDALDVDHLLSERGAGEARR